MHAAILYELTGDPDVDEIPSQLDGDLPAIDATGTQYLDGKTLYHGRAAARITEDVQVPTITPDGITTETEEQQRRVLTDYYVDLEEGWAGIDSSDGEFFVTDLLLSIAGVIGESREIQLDAWAHDFLDATDPYVWGLNYGEETDDGDSIRAGSAFHTDVDLSDVRENREVLSGVGFRYDWSGEPVHGSIFASGYIAVFNDWTPDMFARYLADEVLPYLTRETAGGEQETLDEADASDADEDEVACDECGSVPKEYGLHDDAGDRVCIVCKDKREEDREEAVADGGDRDA